MKLAYYKCDGGTDLTNKEAISQIKDLLSKGGK